MVEGSMRKISQRITNNSKKGVFERVKKWGKHLTLASSLSIASIGSAGCTDCSHAQHPIEQTGMWAEPHHGSVLRDGNNIFMAERFVVKFSDPTTQEDAEDLIREINGKVTGYIPQINVFEVEIDGNVDSSISIIREDLRVEAAGRNYFFEPTEWDNDIYSTGAQSRVTRRPRAGKSRHNPKRSLVVRTH